MPKIRIREYDRTVNEKQEINNYIFMVDSGASNIKICVKATDTEGLNNEDLINRIIDLGGGVIVAKDYNTAATYLKDRNQYDVKFLLTKEGAKAATEAKDNTEATDNTELETAAEIAAYRRDCSVVYTKTSSSYTKKELELLSKTITENEEFADNKRNVYGKYILTFYANELKENNNKLDAGVAYILAYLNSAKTNPEWLAVAGAKRGEIIGNNISCGFMTENDIDNMQPDGKTSGKAGINPIVDMNPWGVRIWGNRTAYVSQEGDNGLTASSFANLRILICDIKKELYKAARKYQFEQNNDILWVNFQSSVNVLLEEMVRSYGIAGYRWYKEETKERAKLCATLQIVPIEPVEDFDLTLELVDSLEISE